MANVKREGTRNRVIRVPDVVWDAAEEIARAEGRTGVSEVIRELLAGYVGMDAGEVRAMHGVKDRNG